MQLLKEKKTFSNFTTTSRKHFHPPIRNLTDAPTIRLKTQASNLEADLDKRRKRKSNKELAIKMTANKKIKIKMATNPIGL